MVTTLEYPLSPKYIPNWTIGEALRELIANAFDVDADAKVSWSDGVASITDSGAGIAKSFWVIGEGNHGEIGQFGEGLKMAMLVLARDNYSVTVETVGYTVVPSLVYSEQYEAKVLALTMGGNIRDEGTSVKVECSHDQFIDAHNRFLRLYPRPFADEELNILRDPGSLFINGVYASHMDSLWGYNITDKTMTNRDRSVLDLDGVQRHMDKTIRALSSPALIYELLHHAVMNTSDHGKLAEYNVMVTPIEENRQLWCSVFSEIFGAKACISDCNTRNDRFLETSGYKVVWSSLPYATRHILKSSGVPTSTQIIKEMGEIPLAYVNEYDLTEDESNVLGIAVAIAEPLTKGALVNNVRVVDSFPSNMNQDMMGLYANNDVYLLRSILGSLEETAGVLIHERIHGLGFDDATVAFESKMTELLGVLATKASQVEE